ncbi:MAG: alpha/beta hydrolase [Deltaproteobacteria bacterium]|nr:alpha/beta hydrolase [Deltaproteobacteria bacterium]
MKTMNVNGVELAYVEQGRGETVVFVHGAISDYRRWELMRPLIAERYHFVSLSLRYHYPNPWKDKGENFTMAQHVEDMAQFIRRLNVGKVHLVGHSFGGAITGRVCINYPELLKSAVLAEALLIPPLSAEGKAAGVDLYSGIEKGVAAERVGDDRTAAMLSVNAILNDPQAFQKSPLTAQQSTVDNIKTLPLFFAVEKTTSPLTCEQISTLRVPILVITGEITAPYFRYVNEALLDWLPKTTASAIIPAARHTFYSDNPEATAKAILDFVARH